MLRGKGHQEAQAATSRHHDMELAEAKRRLRWAVAAALAAVVVLVPVLAGLR
jgi:hypothetical protein